MPEPTGPKRSIPRRLAALTAAVAVVAGGVLAGEAAAAPGRARAAKTTAKSTAPCAGAEGVGGRPPAGSAPGDLVAAVDLTPSARKNRSFPKRARVWRILYVSTGVDEHDLQLVCGTVSAPSKGPAQHDGRARLLAWSHGTIGLQQSCLPSSDPAKHLWGPTPDGIGAISWGSKLSLDGHDGRSSDGILQYAMDHGWVVAATDYQPDDTYIVGRIAGANVLDSARAAAQLVAREESHAPRTYDFITWGHSQGGHAAAWAAQIAEQYLAGTKPSKPTAELHLVGAALEAPASNLVAQPARQPGIEYGDGLADYDMHETIAPLVLPIPGTTLQIGPALFSYIFGSWSELAQHPMTDGARFPAYPAGAAPKLDAIATAEGAKTVETVHGLCLDAAATKIQKATGKYRDARSNRMLVPSLWNLPAKYRTGQYFKGGVDRTCATTTDADLVRWCEWIRWNIPGPLGDNPYAKVPTADGRPVPVLIAQGSNDDIIHCMPTGSSKRVPAASDCMAKALYDSLASAAYCKAGEKPAGHLEMDVLRKQAFRSPATHLSLPGQIASASQRKDKAGLRFSGSHLQRFMDGAFGGTLAAGCRAQVLNR